MSTHLRRVDRYWFQVTPWVLYFGTVALVEIGSCCSDDASSSVSSSPSCRWS